MPYKSQAQQGKFHAMEKKGQISSDTVNEFDQASKGKKLPKKVGKPDPAAETAKPPPRPAKSFSQYFRDIQRGKK